MSDLSILDRDHLRRLVDRLERAAVARAQAVGKPEEFRLADLEYRRARVALDRLLTRLCP